MKETKMPLKLQFFAEGEEEPKQEEIPDVPKDEPKETPKETPKDEQDLMVEIARLKRQLDKASSEAADYKKKFRATQSEKEILDAEKAEAQARRDEEFADMKRRLAISDMTEKYVSLGYPVELAKQAAAADVDQDAETRFKIQAQVDAEKKKAWEKEFIASRPQIAAGTGEQQNEDPFLKGFNSVKH